MAGFIMASVRDTGGRAKLQRLLDTIREKAPTALTKTGEALALQAAARAPSVDEEYMTLMWGDGNPQGLTGTPGGSSNSDGDGRIRLAKDPEEYLINHIPTDYQVTGLYVGVGNVQNLALISRYSWRNIDQTIHIQSKFPLWQAWEYGGSFHIEALSTKADGNRYPLAPSTIPEENRDLFEMDKSIPRKAMYTGLDIAEVVDQVLLPAIDKIVSEA